ncbi:SoxR reducing system RseC family protein [Malonomonas rubra]|uniref:SoxR reducing system RseC family protein n=1 Tax=Malonomonas rubra TaxID=57040 RepID=UPI0026EE6B6E|nr:SoxR reducing system RseC family protein [Malonomonas rubra]
MIEEVGTVVELKAPEIAVVQCKRNSACDHCPSSSVCKMGDDGEVMLVDAFNGVGAKVGDRVRIVTSTKHFLQSSFMLYIVPIIGLLIGALIGQNIGDRGTLGIEPSLFSALLGVTFLIVTFLGIRFVTRKLKREAFMPHIVNIKARADS